MYLVSNTFSPAIMWPLVEKSLDVNEVLIRRETLLEMAGIWTDYDLEKPENTGSSFSSDALLNFLEISK